MTAALYSVPCGVWRLQTGVVQQHLYTHPFSNSYKLDGSFLMPTLFHSQPEGFLFHLTFLKPSWKSRRHEGWGVVPNSNLFLPTVSCVSQPGTGLLYHHPDGVSSYGIGDILTTFGHKWVTLRLAPRSARRLTLIPRSNSPDTIRTKKAMQSQWRGSYGSLNLKTKHRSRVARIAKFYVCFLVSMGFWSKLEEGFKEGHCTPKVESKLSRRGPCQVTCTKAASSQKFIPCFIQEFDIFFTCS